MGPLGRLRRSFVSGIDHAAADEQTDRLESLLNARLDGRDDRRAFVEFNFVRPLHHYERLIGSNNRLRLSLAMLSILGGLTTSAVVAFAGSTGAARPVIAALGLIVGVAGAVDQVLHPSRRSVAYSRACLALRREAWLFVLSEGDYATIKDADLAYSRLVGRVLIELEAVEALEGGDPPSVAAGPVG